MKPKAIPLFAFFVLVIVISLTSVVAANAQQPTPSDDEVNAIAQQLFCPVCENTPLDVCPTQACHDWRELIRQMLAEGKQPAEIKQYFVDHYGARVLSEPPRSGLNWLVYVGPPVIFLVGVYFLFRAFRTWQRSAKEPVEGRGSASKPIVEEEYIARIEEELNKQD